MQRCPEDLLQAQAIFDALPPHIKYTRKPGATEIIDLDKHRR